MIPEYPVVRYAKTATGQEIAYEVLGGGDRDIVFALGLLPNLEHSRELTFLRRWLERLSSIGRVLHYDRRGVGLSDRELGMGSPEERMDDIRAVMDEAGVEKGSIVTSLDGGPIALMFAATFPERVESLALYQSYSRTAWAHDYPAGLRDTTGGLSAHAAKHWGDGSTFGMMVGDPWEPDAARHLLARAERTTSTPGVAARHFELAQKIDVRATVGSVRCPAAVITRAEIRFRSLAEALAEDLGVHATVVPGRWLHSWRDSYEDEALAVVERFIMGEGEDRPVSAERLLTTVLFTDIVNSTARARDLGDWEWGLLLERHDALVRSALIRHRGREIKQTGDGFLASFDGPARAVRCAHAIARGSEALGISVRAGVHTGEVERRAEDISGIAVHVAARVCALASGGEVLATSVVRDLVVGSGLQFRDRGTHVLKGLDAPWSLVGAVDEATR